MSGVEFIVGTILGSVPIAVLAFEKYQVLATAVSTFRNPKEITRMQSKVGAQRTIFRNNSINLLSSLTNDRELVHSWISSLTTISNTGGNSSPNINLGLPDIYRNRIDSLVDAFSSCKSTLDEILVTVEKISEELSSLAKAVGKQRQPTASQSNGSKEWLSGMGGRLKLVWRKSELADAIEDLRNLNSDFSVMTLQIVTTLDQIKKTNIQKKGEKTVTGRAPKRTASDINHIEAYKRVRQASSLLYDTLEKKWTCLSGEHESHAASVCCIGPEHIKVAPTVKLEVALTVQVDPREVGKGNHPLSGPMWLEVEYVDPRFPDHVAVFKTHGNHQSLEELSTALTNLATKSPLVAPSSTQNGSKGPRKVRFDVVQNQSIPGSEPGTALGVKAPDRTSDTKIVDLMLTSDFCGHLHSQYQLCPSNHYLLGCMGGKNLQRFYIPPVDRRVSDEPKTLAAIISWIGTTSIHRSLPLPVALHIAGSLAASVLQFHATPWLPETWRSEDIRFFSAGSLSVESEIQLSHPHFQVQFPKCTEKSISQDLEASKTLTNNTEATLSGVRNELLFRLGIVLLEVGFSRPWHSLRDEMLKSKALLPSRRSDYHVAEKLCVILKNQMGPRYPRIIRKCISCDFGLSEPQDDLEASEELQAVFLVDVVTELQHLKERVQALG